MATQRVATKRPVLAISVLVILGALVLWFAARPGYRRYQVSHAIAQARQCLSRGDARNASLCARRALAANPESLEAFGLMAELAEAAGAPQAIDWRRRVAELSPTTENKLLLAATALRVQQPPFALTSRTLVELAEICKGQATYQVLAAELALKLGHYADAEAHFQEASRLEPDHHVYQLNVAVLRLRSTNELCASAARATLGWLASETNLAIPALRWLADDCVARKEWAEAERFSNRLLALPQTDWNDRLRYLRILHEARSPAFEARLGWVQNLATNEPAAVYTVCAWLNDNGLAERSRRWIAELPANIRSQQPVRLAIAETCISLRDWPALETALKDQAWAEFEFLRLAYLARAAAEQNQESLAEVRWRLAVRQAGTGLGPLRTLLAMADSWSSDLAAKATAGEEVLWQIVQRFPGEGWAVQELAGRYAREGNTRGLHKLYAAGTARVPADLVAKNNYAATSMLLGLNLAQAHAAASEIYQRHPEEPIFASTYAYSLHLRGRTRDALAVFEKLPAAALQRPALALYYGILLSADGQGDRAAKYLALASEVTLLPEEKTLAAQAQQGLPH